MVSTSERFPPTVDAEDGSRLGGSRRLQFHLLAFEGPAAYSRAGGLATRVVGLAETLANLDFETHLWFIGDPDLPAHETHGPLHYHRWCQWVSKYHPCGVYDGELGKAADYNASLPPYLLREVLLPRLDEEGQDGQAVILDWHDPGLLFLALAIVVMSCIDALFTLNLLTVGGEEINLFMRVLIEQDVSSFLQVKISVTAISVVVLVAASQYRVLGKLPVRRMLQAIFLVYGTLIAYEVVLLLGYFHDAVNTPPINF